MGTRAIREKQIFDPTGNRAPDYPATNLVTRQTKLQAVPARFKLSFSTRIYINVFRTTQPITTQIVKQLLMQDFMCFPDENIGKRKKKKKKK
jgi:hypothetical protein